jgi:hypothetical protein
MVKANELISFQKERNDKKKDTFEKIFVHIEKKILLASAANYYYTWYQIPEFLVGLPLYSIKDCHDYIENKLKSNGFDTEFYEPNIIHIKWFPKQKK